jgi:tellurite resistance protein
LAPDPRYGLRMPKEGEPVVLFECDETGDAENASGAYRKALIELALGAFIAQADGRVSESEERLLANRVVQVTDVSDFERRLLKANLDWFLTVPSDMSTLRSRLKDVDSDQQTALRAAMIAVAHADGIIQTEEVAGIEKIYRILGLDPSTVYSDLHAGEVSDAPVRVKAAEPGAPGEAIPEEISTSRSRLDPSRIAAIRSDTARVSSVLGQIFQSEPDPEPESSISLSRIAGLDAKCAALVRDVITKDYWSEDAFADLAKRHGLMPLGALEAINEWSFATYDEALLDEHDGYDVTDDIAQALKKQFEKEVA